MQEKRALPVVRDGLAFQHGDRIGAEAGVQGLHQAEGREGLCHIDMSGHGGGVDAGIGAAGGVDGAALAGDGEGGFLDCLLHAGAVISGAASP